MGQKLKSSPDMLSQLLKHMCKLQKTENKNISIRVYVCMIDLHGWDVAKGSRPLEQNPKHNGEGVTVQLGHAITSRIHKSNMRVEGKGRLCKD